ncbi:MAG: DUF2863 family protein [Burkholderiaceae bacterium]|jgi:hypothetical protein
MMKRKRNKSPSPRLTRDAELLVVLATGLANSGSHIEDRFWDRRLSAELIRLLEHGSDSALEHALDHLHRGHLPAYDVLIDAAEAQSESAGLDGEQVLLLAAPVLAWSKYSIFSGPLRSDVAQALGAHLASHIAARGVRVALSPYLYSIDQLPQRFSKTRELTQTLGRRALLETARAPTFAKLPQTAPLLADTRYLIAALVGPGDGALMRWQEQGLPGAETSVGRAEVLVHWREAAGALLAQVLTGSQTELLLPDAYHVSCRESDQAVRPFGIRAAVAFLETALTLEPERLRAVVALFGEERGEEYRIGFTLENGSDVYYGVVWPLFGREEGPEPEGPRDQIEALLKDCRIHEMIYLDQLFPLEFCEDCGAPLFADPSGELVHPELPEDAEEPRAHLH